MTEIVDQLRADLMAAIHEYQQLFNERPMPDARRQDIAKLIHIIRDESHQRYYDCMNAVESYIARIKTIWWPFHNKSRLHDSLQSILEDYRHPEIQALIERIHTQQKQLAIHKQQSTGQQLNIFSQWISQLSEKVELIKMLQSTLIHIRNEKTKPQKANGHFYDHLRYWVKHPANECLE